MQRNHRRHVPTSFLINQCQIITFLILKSDIIENSRIELRNSLASTFKSNKSYIYYYFTLQLGTFVIFSCFTSKLKEKVVGLLGGQRVCWPPPHLSNYWGGLPWPPPPSSYTYVLKTWQTDRMQEKNTIFKFVPRPYYAPARMSLGLTRPSYVLSRAWSRTHHVCCIFNTFFLRPFKSHYALTVRFTTFSCTALFEILQIQVYVDHVFNHSAGFLEWTVLPKGRSRDDIKARKWVEVQNLASVFMLVVSVW